MKLAMYIGCEYAPGQRTGFDFDVNRYAWGVPEEE